jgi:mRNA-degrading endonuclease RelE of RelBE toxin-antitoxin system
MNWKITLSREAVKFLTDSRVKESIVVDKVTLAIRKLRGEDVNIDIKKLKGDWEGFYRIRYGKVRILLDFEFEEYRVHIERIDWRGGAYK